MTQPRDALAPAGSAVAENLDRDRRAVADPAEHAETPVFQAWCYLVWLSIGRLARLRQMVWIALGLLVIVATVIGLNRLAGRTGMSRWRWNWIEPGRPLAVTRDGRPTGQSIPMPSRVVPYTFDDTVKSFEMLPAVFAPNPSAASLQTAFASAFRLGLVRSPFYQFSNWLVFSVFLGFLLPIWTLSFATEALGGEREGRTLVWLLTRPIPRPAVYLAKFTALLPWTLALNLGGFALLCVLAGEPGLRALRLYWPAVLAGTLAFAALFHLMGACFRRAAIIALVYSFFLETILGSMPGYMKRISLSFYTRCIMFEAAQDYGVQPEKASIYLPVTANAAWLVLGGVTIALLVAGMVVFSRSEYQDLT